MLKSLFWLLLAQFPYPYFSCSDYAAYGATCGGNSCGIPRCDNCSSGKCTNCHSKGLSSPKVLVFDPITVCCVASCVSGYYLASLWVCNPCPTGCQTCSSATACICCASGYRLSGGLCVTTACPSGTY